MNSVNRNARRSLRASAPRFVQVIQVREDEQVRTLECRVEGYPKPDIRWEKSGRPVGKSRRVHMTRSGDRCLLQMKMPCSEEESGTYICIATNIIGTTQSRTFCPSTDLQKMNGASSNNLRPLKINGIRSRSTERSSESMTESRPQRSVFRIRSQSGSRKASEQDSSKSKLSTFTSHLWPKNDGRNDLRKACQKQKTEIVVDISKKQLSISMEDCRKNRGSFLNRVKIPDIFSAQKSDGVTESRTLPSRETSIRNGGIQANTEIRLKTSSNINSVTGKDVDNGLQLNGADDTTARTEVDETPIQLSTRERIAAYLKRFESSAGTGKSKESQKQHGRTYKRGMGSEKKHSSVAESNTSDRTENDRTFFSKFRRRKSCDSERNKNEVRIEECSSGLQKNSKCSLEHPEQPQNIQKQSTYNRICSPDVSETIQLDDIYGFVNTTSEAEYFRGADHSVSISKPETLLDVDKPFSDCSSCDIDLGSFEPIDINLMDSFKELQKEPEHLSQNNMEQEGSTDCQTTVSKQPPEVLVCEPREHTIPLIRIEQTPDASYSSDELEEDTCSKKSIEVLTEEQPINYGSFKKPSDRTENYTEEQSVNCDFSTRPSERRTENFSKEQSLNHDSFKKPSENRTEIFTEEQPANYGSLNKSPERRSEKFFEEQSSDNDSLTRPFERRIEHFTEEQPGNDDFFKKPFKGKIKYSSPLIEEECETLAEEEDHRRTPETDFQRVSSPVECPARIVKGPQSVTVLRGESVTLAISFDGHPTPRVTWIKGGSVLEERDCRLSILEGRDMSVVTVSDVTADDSGKYVVSVENEGGGDSCFASVAVVGFPEPPGGEPNVSEVTDHSLVLSWYGSMYDGGSVVTGYHVEMCTLPDKKWHKVASSINTSCSVLGLSKGQRYVFRVRAENRYGPSLPSKDSNVICLDDFLQEESSSDEEPGEEMAAPITIESGTSFTERFDLKEEVGKGRFGTVYRCVEVSCGRPRAAKVIRCLKVKDKEKVRQEIEIMSRLQHPKLMQVLAAFESGRNMIMVMEFISGGELFERVIADDFVLTEQDCILFMRQICDGVVYMHNNDVIHLDLKPENILCKTRTSHKIKIIDFGLARVYKADESLRVLFGTPEFVAPEVINYEPVCPASDMWSVGVICYVLLSGLSPFMGDSDSETFANITRGEMDFEDEAFDEISQDAKDFISRLLVKQVKSRLSAQECLKHPWLATGGLQQKRPLSTEKLKRFIIRRKWQKSGNAIRALGRMVSLSRSSLGSSCDSYSPLGSPTSQRSRSRSSLVSRSETTESGESDVFQDLVR